MKVKFVFFLIIMLSIISSCNNGNRLAKYNLWYSEISDNIEVLQDINKTHFVQFKQKTKDYSESVTYQLIAEKINKDAIDINQFLDSAEIVINSRSLLYKYKPFSEKIANNFISSDSFSLKLVTKLNQFNDDLFGLIDTIYGFRNIKEYNPDFYPEIIKDSKSWFSKEFKGKNNFETILTFKMIQQQTLVKSSFYIENLLLQIGRYDIRFIQIIPIFMPEKNIIYQNEDVLAKIFLGSFCYKPNVYIYINSKKIYFPDTKTIKFTMETDKPGLKTYEGILVFPHDTSVFTTPFSFDYLVK